MDKQSSFSSFLVQTNSVSSDVIHSLNYHDDQELIVLISDKFDFSKNYLEKLKSYYDSLPKTLLLNDSVDNECLKLMTKEQAYSFMVVPFERKNACLNVAMKNPLDQCMKDKLSYFFEETIVPYFVEASVLNKFLRERFPFEEELKEKFEAVLSRVKKINFGKIVTYDVNYDEPVQLLDYILREGIKLNASDIHIGLENSFINIAYRVDGDLQTKIFEFGKIADILLRRIKVLASLDTTSSLLPQDGTFPYSFDGKNFNMRVSVLQAKRGFSVVMRISSIDKVSIDLEKAIYDQRTRDTLHSFINKKEGMLIISGPTGSGKTTTLYASLMKMFDGGKRKIFSIEDPVEMNLSGVTQVQLSEEIGLNYSTILKAALRQDPDVIMLGEIRDQETANIAARAAITGHKVLSTMHTKDTIGVVDRFLNLDVDSFILGAGLNLVISQRLMKKICTFCKKEKVPGESDRKILCAMLGKPVDIEKLYFGVGCNYCNGGGYIGRIPVYELLEINHEMATAISLKNISEFRILAEEYLLEKKLVNFGFHLLKIGITTLEEQIALFG